ncbi:MAG: PHP domain-containing protein [Chloroflexi bacterium]|nr:PHP domain-containing protein [Chloroflexota bacterium]
MGTADLHTHTRYGDGMATVPELLDHVARMGTLDVIAVTEHDTLGAADEARELHARRAYSFDVICGIEVTTLDGHLVALFVDEPIPSFRRMEPTLEAIHTQGGIAIVPHPLSWLTRSVKTRVLDRVAAAKGNDGVYFDAIEEYNMSPAGRVTSARARALNRDRFHLAAVGCSDAHFLAAVGSARTVFEGRTAADLRRAIETKATSGEAGRAPRMSELGYRNIAVQSWRGMMATPRNMGWAPTIRSFIVSHVPQRPKADGPKAGER